MKSVFIHLVCCGGLLLAILLVANGGLVLGLLRNNWDLFLSGLLVMVVGITYYVWRRQGCLKRQQ